ncbi:EcWRKY-61 [Eragrostis curvula]|uniref:EcWRKY-61 n=1 Tax=Eragrostis curvula TaxID=38414 RepID=A0A5J9WIX1_9POAL|nr:EcWRKY-61 [Eragrostis curvula]
MSPAPSSHQSHMNSRKEKRMRKVDTFAPHNDGHQWRKYGEKKINNTNFPRYYYRCTYKDNMNCPATKQVQQKDHSDPPLYAVTYYNEHTCNSAFLPLSPSEFQLQTSSGKAVSICFDSSAPQEPSPAANAGGSPSSSATAAAAVAVRRGTPPEAKRPQPAPVLQRSETYPWGAGAVEQKPASCSTECHDAFSGAAGAVPEEVVDAGRFGSIRKAIDFYFQETNMIQDVFLNPVSTCHEAKSTRDLHVTVILLVQLKEIPRLISITEFVSACSAFCGCNLV